MLSATPTRQPGESFRRKVAAHWGTTYAELEALALGEDPPPASHDGVRSNVAPPNLEEALRGHAWTPQLPEELRIVVREQARQHYVFGRTDLPVDVWRKILTGLEREALLATALLPERDGPNGDGASPSRLREG